MTKDTVLKTILKHFDGRFTPEMLCIQLRNDLGYRVNYFETWRLLRDLKQDGTVRQISLGWYSLELNTATTFVA